MDIWAWTHEKDEQLRNDGHERLAEIIIKFPEHVLANELDLVDLYAAEAIQLAREIEEPWVEIFIRHWRMQSTLCVRQEPKDNLKEAVALLEFSHRPENIDCPQSVCTVQDIAICYGATDGPAYSQERIDVCQETLKRISPKWNCFGCVSAEYIKALYDRGDFEGAKQKMDELTEQGEQGGGAMVTPDMELTRARILTRLGDFESARRAASLVKLVVSDPFFKQGASIYMALGRALQGEYTEAMQELPDYELIKTIGANHGTWVEVVSLCLANDATSVQGNEIDHAMQMLVYAQERGAIRIGVEMGGRLVKMQMSVGDTQSAKKALDIMKELQPQLAADLGASELIADAEKQVSEQSA